MYSKYGEHGKCFNITLRYGWVDHMNMVFFPWSKSSVFRFELLQNPVITIPCLVFLIIVSFWDTKYGFLSLFSR